eukprot:1603246-Rhodomonas_salina.2
MSEGFDPDVHLKKVLSSLPPLPSPLVLSSLPTPLVLSSLPVFSSSCPVFLSSLPVLFLLPSSTLPPLRSALPPLFCTGVWVHSSTLGLGSS